MDAERRPVEVTRTGAGPEILLVHGGAGAATTWRGLEPLAARWTLAMVHRRGFPPSPPPTNGRIDFAEDADDLVGLVGLISMRAHLVAHSYGAIGAMLAAARVPDRVRSLTLLEPPGLLAHTHAGHLREIAEDVIAHGAGADPAALREFLQIAGVPVPAEGPLPDPVLAGVRRAKQTRSPYEAVLPVDALRAAPFPVLVATGAHYEPIEKDMDDLAEALGAARCVAPGAGHFIAAAPGFAETLATFLASAP